MECFGAVATLDSRSLCLAAEARELLFVDQQLQSLANVDPLLSLDAKARKLVELHAVLVEEERLSNHLRLSSVFKLTEWTDQR